MKAKNVKEPCSFWETFIIFAENKNMIEKYKNETRYGINQEKNLDSQIC